jgi:hypothetical protein
LPDLKTNLKEREKSKSVLKISLNDKTTEFLNKIKNIIFKKTPINRNNSSSLPKLN